MFVDDLETTRPVEDVVIVGGGVAGLSAALWAHRLGYDPLLIDAGQRLGGQLHLVHRPMIDLPAMPPMTGSALAARLVRQFVGHGGRWLKMRMVAARPDGDRVRLVLEAPKAAIAARTLVVATGVRRRTLDVEGEQRLRGRGMLETAATDIAHLKGRRVVVVGGGDAACENALLLAETGARVTLVHRGPSLSARHQLVEPVRRHADIELLLQRHVRAFVGDNALEAVLVDGPGGRERRAADAALVRIGYQPNNDGLASAWLDARGYLRADQNGRLPDVPRVFAAGEILGPLCPSVAMSMGSGATAARAACMLLESEGVRR